MPLVLQRHVGERIVIDDDVVITVLGADHYYVRLGFQAPAQVSVDREEIWLRKRGDQTLRLVIDSADMAQLIE